MKLNAYLNFNGHCEAAFKFYEQLLGGKIMAMMKYSDSPMADQVPAESRNAIMHASMVVGDHVFVESGGPELAPGPVEVDGRPRPVPVRVCSEVMTRRASRWGCRRVGREGRPGPGTRPRPLRLRARDD